MSGDVWQRFTAALQRLTDEVPELAHVVAGQDPGDAAGRYRTIVAMLTEIAWAASELDDDRVRQWSASDATAALRTAAATAALEADGLAVDAAMDSDAHLRRALHWRRFGCRTTDDLHRRCAMDVSRGSLRLLARTGAGRVTSRLELQRIRLELVRDLRRQYADLRAELLTRVPSGRAAVGSFEADARERLAEVADRARDATARALGVSGPGGRWPRPEVTGPMPAQRPDELWLGLVLGAGFGLGAALGLARLATGLAGVPDGIGGAVGLALGLALTVAVVGGRARLHRRAVLERWVGAAVAVARQASEEELAYRLLEAQAGMATADHKTKN
ncbi:hypothetical protein OS122_27750 [Mycolicibacterium mucogenicum]|uniref:hypothetical protein n=1 Tax=Mycolicibacterium mucogenicum TaxID=56689 RepID=UPI00226AE3D4|nr:hypothetical protein [Mycolicibacterium mucogenicum]MCX8564684.1 hypothetical protein [Mycolicibacterium mucogenicum]